MELTSNSLIGNLHPRAISSLTSRYEGMNGFLDWRAAAFCGRALSDTPEPTNGTTNPLYKRCLTLLYGNRLDGPGACASSPCASSCSAACCAWPSTNFECQSSIAAVV